jgi:hypothetical protein
VTEDDERELFRKLNRIDRRLGILGGLAIGAVALTAAYFVTKDVEREWGLSSDWSWLAGLAVVGAIAGIYGRDYDRFW